jgi:hypothetical protein
MRQRRESAASRAVPADPAARWPPLFTPDEAKTLALW